MIFQLSVADMKKCSLITLFLLLNCISVNAQKGRNQFNIAAEVSVPVYQNDRGWGVFGKGMYGVGHSAQLTLMAGVSTFKSKNSIEQNRNTIRMIPVLVGYKRNIKKVYIEPQAGYGELGGKVNIGGDYSRPSVGAFFWAVGAGYDHKKIIAGIRFQQAHGASSADAGLWHNKNFHHVSFQLAYKLF
jgi:hypothetical protein